jgi:hypothetical protein
MTELNNNAGDSDPAQETAAAAETADGATAVEGEKPPATLPEAPATAKAQAQVNQAGIDRSQLGVTGGEDVSGQTIDSASHVPNNAYYGGKGGGGSTVEQLPDPQGAETTVQADSGGTPPAALPESARLQAVQAAQPASDAMNGTNSTSSADDVWT